MRVPSRRTALALGAALLVGLAVTLAATRLARPKRPNLVLVTIDTLRADHLPFYGYERDTAPFLSELAAEGVVFEYATSTSSWTVPSMASLVTSLYPQQHGLTRAAYRDEHGDYVEPAISESVETLAERLKGLGYRTHAVVTNRNLSSELGYAQGFDRFEHVGWLDANAVYATLHPMLLEVTEEEPYFLWVHLFDPHTPYRSVEPWAALFDEDLAARSPEVARLPEDVRALRRRRVSSVPPPFIKRDAVDNPLLVDTLQVLYDSEIRHVDDWLEQLFAVLDPGPDAVVAITADHGEEFMDHGSMGHRSTLYGEVTRVPLVVWSPENLLAGARIAAPASLVDLLPTFVEAAGGEVGSDVQGASLWPACVSGEPLPERDLLLTLSRVDGETRAMVRYPKKLIVRPGGQSSLFDLSRDPLELDDLAGDRPSELRVLRTAMRAAFEALPESERVLVRTAGEKVEQLRALGYVDDEH